MTIVQALASPGRVATWAFSFSEQRLLAALVWIGCWALLLLLRLRLIVGWINAMDSIFF
jgi:hypothetical protein